MKTFVWRGRFTKVASQRRLFLSARSSAELYTPFSPRTKAENPRCKIVSLFDPRQTVTHIHNHMLDEHQRVTSNLETLSTPLRRQSTLVNPQKICTYCVDYNPSTMHTHSIWSISLPRRQRGTCLPLSLSLVLFRPCSQAQILSSCFSQHVHS